MFKSRLPPARKIVESVPSFPGGMCPFARMEADDPACHPLRAPTPNFNIVSRSACSPGHDALLATTSGGVGSFPALQARACAPATVSASVSIILSVWPRSCPAAQLELEHESEIPRSPERPESSPGAVSWHKLPHPPHAVRTGSLRPWPRRCNSRRRTGGGPVRSAPDGW